MIIDIVLISYNTQTLLLKCLNTLHHVPQGVEIGNIIVVDNASNDLTVENVRDTFPNVQVIALQENLGYASAVNIGFKQTSSEWVFIGNSDIEFRPNTLISLFEGMSGFSDVGICCPQQVYPDNSRQRSWGFFPGMSEAIHYITFTSAIENILESISMKIGMRRKSRYIPYADGAALLIQSEAFKHIGGFDTNFFFFGEEADFCHRMWASGKGVLFVPTSIIMHVRGATYGGNSPSLQSIQMLIDSKIRFIKKNTPHASIGFIMCIMGFYHAIMTILFTPFSIFTKRFRGKVKMNAISTGLYFMKIRSRELTTISS
jgi:GT2 family glycosyltransferase